MNRNCRHWPFLFSILLLSVAVGGCAALFNTGTQQLLVITPEGTQIYRYPLTTYYNDSLNKEVQPLTQPWQTIEQTITTTERETYLPIIRNRIQQLSFAYKGDSICVHIDPHLQVGWLIPDTYFMIPMIIDIDGGYMKGFSPLRVHFPKDSAEQATLSLPYVEQLPPESLRSQRPGPASIEIGTGILPFGNDPFTPQLVSFNFSYSLDDRWSILLRLHSDTRALQYQDNTIYYGIYSGANCYSLGARYNITPSISVEATAGYSSIGLESLHYHPFGDSSLDFKVAGFSTDAFEGSVGISYIGKHFIAGAHYSAILPDIRLPNNEYATASAFYITLGLYLGLQ